MSAYNGARTLRESVESILAQQGVEMELIVVDDGSTDDTLAILSEAAATDSRMRVLTQPNAGITAGLILGCANARGKFIARQDAGDRSLPGRLALQCSALEADRELSFVSCWTEVCGPRQEFLSTEKGTGRAARPTDIIAEDEVSGVIDGPSHHGSVMFRRDRYELAGGYRAQFYFGQDWDLWYRLAEGGKFQMVENVLYRAPVTPDGLSGRYRDAQNAIGKLAKGAMLRRRRGQDENDLLGEAAAIRPGPNSRVSAAPSADGLYFIAEQLRRNGDERAMRYFRETIATAPTDIRPWVRMAQFGAAKIFRRMNGAKRR